ncbi:MAG: hypothetical protein M9936_31395 [Caldilinea sp.]|nr:hypothetical protein [Caldilinea sp.]
MLDAVDLTQSLKKSAYKPVRKAQLERIFDLSELIYEQKRPVIIVFEGWDAAGKGTTIRQLTQRLDARGYKVLATQAPRTHEQRKPWLWRFWMNIPRHGQIAIFDRSWYGRVLVERVNGLTPMAQWIAAYEEINGFERTLADDGTIFLKFWLHIAKDEQLRRFMQLASEPENAWRVTAEDWENHRRYGEYLAAVRDMIDKTSTAIAPWTVVPATDGDVRLYTVCDAIITRLEAALGLEASSYPSIDALVAGKIKPAKAKKEKSKTKKKKKKPADTDTLAEETITIIVEKDAPPAKKSKASKKAKKVESDGATADPSNTPAVVAEVLPSPEPVAVDGAPPPPARRRKKTPAVPAANADAEVDHA